MNFLSHFYFEKEKSPEFIFGLLLPDLYPGFNQLLRKKINHTSASTAATQKIRNGIDRHFSHDKIFHQSDFFIENEAYVKKHLNLSCFKSNRARPFLLRHIYIEMLMDRILLNETPEYGEKFYYKLTLLDKNNLEIFFNELDSSELVPDFFVIFSRFLNSKFLLNYIDNLFFINALIRSYKRVVSYISFEKSDLQLLHSFVERDSIALKPEIMRFFDSFEYK